MARQKGRNQKKDMQSLSVPEAEATDEVRAGGGGVPGAPSLQAGGVPGQPSIAGGGVPGIPSIGAGGVPGRPIDRFGAGGVPG
jgi:hypothetical protein